MHSGTKHGKNAKSSKVARGVWIFVAVLLLAIWVPTFSYIGWRSWRENRPDVIPRIDLSAGHGLIYDLAQVKIGDALWFTYPVGSERIGLALQKNSSGTIRVVFASCMACYPHRREHKFKGGQLICGRCRHAMRLGDQEEELTAAKGCVAVPVPFSADKRLLAVRASDIEERFRELQWNNNPSR